MAVTIDEANATIETESANANPQVSLRTTLNDHIAFWNLTRGFNTDPEKLVGAFSYTGHVPVTGTPAELAGFRFGFIQFMKIREYRIVWSGRSFNEGSIILDLGKAVGTAPILDCAPASRRPFFTPPVSKVSNGEMTTTMGDHPFSRVADQIPNKETHFDNYLHSIVDRRVATSTFVAIGPDGRIRPLGHVSFSIDYIMDFRWTDAQPEPKPSVAMDRSQFIIGFAGGGAPPETLVPRAQLLGAGSFGGLLANAASREKMANPANFQVVKQAQLGGAQPFFI